PKTHTPPVAALSQRRTQPQRRRRNTPFILHPSAFILLKTPTSGPKTLPELPQQPPPTSRLTKSHSAICDPCHGIAERTRMPFPERAKPKTKTPAIQPLP